MLWYKRTHRCEESLKNEVSIRLDNHGWYIASMMRDFEWDCYHMIRAGHNIRFCPYCGEELKND